MYKGSALSDPQPSKGTVRRKILREEEERELIHRAQSGDDQAFVELIHPYRKRLFLVSRRKLNQTEEAEDVVQDVILRVYLHLHRFQPSQSFSAWIYRITLNLCIDRLRKKKADFHLDDPGTGGMRRDMYNRVLSIELTPEELLLKREQEQEVSRAINGLPPRYRMVMMLRYMGDLPLSDISEILHLPVTTVKTRVYRGRKALQHQLAATL
ncbi:sigma-70 family RNA polymerase sigma factor [Marininema halotolerans]|uniref:RNA polymerase sigma factor n=1 Tax=Marininema halotolerans TaxID=1155944 RepID=A0A1I6THR7_9BACL|nr:sigma-70 family RNA polymerase sigma factor [Marininema halotolerans]SFS88557.1 RNA polymerase sigma-70 factor, ECF subfamily [Marininema halotolerans]